MFTSEPLVIVVIPHWNNRSLLDDCIESLERSTYGNLQVIVVDNASTDDSVPYIRAKFPWVSISQRTVNGGYAAGLNTGIRNGYKNNPKYYFLLNNDTILKPDTISDLVNVMESNEEIGMSAPLVLYHSDPTITFSLGDRTYKWLPLPIRFGLQKKDQAKNHHVIEFDYIFGCAMFVRTSILEEIGLFDESFFMFYEDADFCRRTRDAGFKVVRVGSTSIIHKASQSVKEESNYMIHLRARNRFIFYRKYKHGPHVFLTLFALGLGSIWKVTQFLITRRTEKILPYIQGSLEGIKAPISSAQWDKWK